MPADQPECPTIEFNDRVATGRRRCYPIVTDSSGQGVDGSLTFHLTASPVAWKGSSNEGTAHRLHGGGVILALSVGMPSALAYGSDQVLIPTDTVQPEQTGDQPFTPNPPDTFGKPVTTSGDPSQTPPEPCSAGQAYYVLTNYANDFHYNWGTSVYNGTLDNSNQTVTESVTVTFDAQFGLTLSTSVRVALIGKIEAQVNAAAGMSRTTYRGDQITVTTRPGYTTKVDRGVVREKVRMRITDWYANCTHVNHDLDVNGAERSKWRAYNA